MNVGKNFVAFGSLRGIRTTPMRWTGPMNNSYECSSLLFSNLGTFAGESSESVNPKGVKP
jgi:hypothetical protein